MKRLIINNLINDYIFGKQTLRQLSLKYNISVSTVQRNLSKLNSVRMISRDKQVVVLMDATYWGGNFGVVVFKDSRTKKILWRKFITRKETLSDYSEGVDWLLENEFNIDGIVCDGLKGLFNIFAPYRVQMCQFHQVQIVRRYLTKRPELPASIELLAITNMLCHTDKESFEGLFNEWLVKWDSYLKERYIDVKTSKSHYTHKRLRSAYLSIKHNMPYLWTWYDNIDVGIPNTNNGLEGQFTDLKTKLRNHNGLSKTHRKIFIDEYFKGSYLKR